MRWEGERFPFTGDGGVEGGVQRGMERVVPAGIDTEPN